MFRAIDKRFWPPRSAGQQRRQVFFSEDLGRAGGEGLRPEFWAPISKVAFFCAQAAALRMMMREGKGNIINISSLGGLGLQAWPSYMAALLRVESRVDFPLTRTLAKALAPTVSAST